MKDIVALFCFIQDFLSNICDNPNLENMKKKSTRTTNLTMSELMTIFLLHFKFGASNFKSFYNMTYQSLKYYFPNLISYDRLISLKKRMFKYLKILISYIISLSEKTGKFYIDSTHLKVCENKRIHENKNFNGVARRGKTSVGWFYGLKLHLLINEKGEIVNFMFTPGNIDDREPVENLVKHLFGLLFGDKGYISGDLSTELIEKGLKLVTGIKNNMKNKFMILEEKILLRKRSVIESVFNVMKNHIGVNLSRSRSIWNASVDLLLMLITYCLRKNKPAIRV